MQILFKVAMYQKALSQPAATSAITTTTSFFFPRSLTEEARRRRKTSVPVFPSDIRMGSCGASELRSWVGRGSCLLTKGQGLSSHWRFPTHTSTDGYSRRIPHSFGITFTELPGLFFSRHSSEQLGPRVTDCIIIPPARAFSLRLRRVRIAGSCVGCHWSRYAGICGWGWRGIGSQLSPYVEDPPTQASNSHPLSPLVVILFAVISTRLRSELFYVRRGFPNRSFVKRGRAKG